MDDLAKCKLKKAKGPMKGIFRIIPALLFPLLFWTGCGDGLETSRMEIPDHCIEITLNGLHPTLSTKASSQGTDAYNENLVKSVDCFFYPNGATGSDAVFMALGRGAEAKTVTDPVSGKDSTVYVVKVFFTDADAHRMFGNTVSGTCEFYVICNAPLSYDGHTDVATLKNLVVENDFTTQTVQSSFVMSADEVATVTLTTDGENVRTASGSIKVSRAAAKIQFFLLIPQVFEDEAHQSWEPVLDAGIGISLSNAVKRGKVDGDYVVQTSDYVSYGSRSLTALAAGNEISGYEDYKYTHVPFYSYPCAWSDLSDYATTVVFRIPWRIVGEDDYQWKKYQLSPNVSTLDLKRNTYYRTFVNVRSLGGADKDSFVIIPECDYQIIPWMNEGTSGGGQGEVPGEFITYKYLVMDHPEQTINNETTVYFSYVTSSPISSIVLNKVEYYNNKSATPLQTQTLNETITDNRQTVSTNAGDIVVNKENSGYVIFQHSLDNMYSPIRVYASVINADGCIQNVIFTQNPSISLECDYVHMGDVFVDGFFARVTGATFGRNWTIGGKTYQYASGNATQTTPTGTSGDGGRMTLSTLNSNAYGDYGSVSFGTETDYQNPYITTVNVTSFNTDNCQFTVSGVTRNYRTGDPRIPASELFGSWTLYPYLTYWNGTNANGNTFGNWISPEKIMVTIKADEGQDIIAPSFLIASTRNSQHSKPNSYTNSAKRAAVYQEAGYPAGRWRLPTEAEIAFIVARQKDGTVPILFKSNNSGYWTASGKRVTISADFQTITVATVAENSGISSRFVYDVWYWGDAPSTTNVYHPNGHLYNYDSSGNATLIR